MEKLIRGVIYDDVEFVTIKDEMFDLMDSMDDIRRAGKLENHLKTYQPDALSLDETEYVFKNLDSIAALTRLDHNHKTHNMIIPKEALSEKLVKQLSSVDLAPTMIEDYMTHYSFTYMNEDQEEPEDLYDNYEDDEERLAELLDNIAANAQPGERIIITPDSEIGQLLTKLYQKELVR